jgi:hypothetical protein
MAKRRGVRLGQSGSMNLKSNIAHRQKEARTFAEKLLGQVEGFRLRGLSQREMVSELNKLCIKGHAEENGRSSSCSDYWHSRKLWRLRWERCPLSGVCTQDHRRIELHTPRPSCPMFCASACYKKPSG